MRTNRKPDEIAADPQPGDIYEGSWGYDQTNAEFWQVVKRTPGTVTLRQLSMIVIDGRVGPSENFRIESKGWTNTPDGESFYDTTGAFVEKLCKLGRGHYALDGVGRSLKMKSYYNVYPWDGQTAWDTIAAGQPGH